MLTIVVADPDPEHRLLVRFSCAWVADSITIVGEAADGEEALRLVMCQHPDVVVTGMGMPGLDGMELTRRIKQDLPKTKVVLMTSRTDETTRRLAAAGGADAWVSKEATGARLLPAIRNAARAA